MLQSLLELNNYLNTYQNLLEKEINEFKIGDDHHRALTTIRRLLKGLNFWVVDKINNLENYYAFRVFILQIFNPISEHAVAIVRIDAGIFVDAAVG